MSYTSVLRATDFVHNFLKHKINKGSIVIDGTMGNGHDTLFLHRLVGASGKVYAFDIQEKALEATKQKLLYNNVAMDNNSIHLILDGHENIESHVKEPIDAAMFNLGYLPNSNKEIITIPQTTIRAFDGVFSLLKKGGVVSILIYYGHRGGILEKELVLDYIRNLDYKKYTVLECNYTNHENNPPIIVFIEKKQ
ncbi:tRNA (mnm(5)s(2)U34)-methyltransferase [Natronincola ferrireducens]|uniref:Putative rRNA methylase n=1 Tax=Natronincola ferrireducens TaxID=393762 RepID=A0A1G9C8Y0_9FIRM|nr:class I SAM-dependent methyltransferase [Natronincola ferrireducens]SDK48093.1 Putative rRNA methylase [Natronincola ferrireducens]